MSARKIRLFLLLPVGLLAPRMSSAQVTGPPPTPVVPVADTYFDTTIVDPYRWLENTDDEAVIEWMRAQDAWTREVLGRIPGRDELLARIKQLNAGSTSVTEVQLAGERVFYLLTAPGDEVGKLYFRSALDEDGRLLVDPEQMSTEEGAHYSLDWFTPSPDGQLVAYGMSPSGSEESVLRVIEVESGRVLPDSIERVMWGLVSWRPDGRSLFYNQMRELGADEPIHEKYRGSRVYLHQLGEDPSVDTPILGMEVSSTVSIDPDDFPLITVSEQSSWALAVLVHGVQNEVTLLAAPLAEVSGPDVAWMEIATPADSVLEYEVHGDEVFLRTNSGAPRYRVVRTSLGDPDLAGAHVVMPESERVIESIAAAEDALYVKSLEAGLTRLHRVPFEGDPVSLELPFEGYSWQMAAHVGRPGLLFDFESWTRPPLWYFFDPTSGELRETSLQPPSSVDFSRLRSLETSATSHDGVEVPLSIVYPAEARRDGGNYVYLIGYGAYGFPITPYASDVALAGLERGAVRAVCHVRGGGELGLPWHAAGRLETKSNSWRDFIACAEYLIREGWTSPEHLAANGGSAGGIVVGMAIQERPDLFRVAAAEVGALNAVREMEVGVSGPANRPEFGDPETEDGFRALLAMDAYLQMDQGVEYPAVLATVGMTDPRVDPWVPAKYVARMQASSSSDRPVLLRVEFEAGHGMGSTQSQVEEELADFFAFLFWQLGHPDFQP